MEPGTSNAEYAFGCSSLVSTNLNVTRLLVIAYRVVVELFQIMSQNLR